MQMCYLDEVSMLVLGPSKKRRSHAHVNDPLRHVTQPYKYVSDQHGHHHTSTFDVSNPSNKSHSASTTHRPHFRISTPPHITTTDKRRAIILTKQNIQTQNKTKQNKNAHTLSLSHTHTHPDWSELVDALSLPLTKLKTKIKIKREARTCTPQTKTQMQSTKTHTHCS